MEPQLAFYTFDIENFSILGDLVALIMTTIDRVVLCYIM